MRPARWQYLPFLVGPATVFGMDRWEGSGPHPEAEPSLRFFAILAVIFAVCFLWVLLYVRVTLTESAAIVSVFRRRHVAWAQVQAVTRESQLGGRWVSLWTEDGKQVKLPAPKMSWPGPGRTDYERSYHVIGQWWLDHRGPDWQTAW
jgi:hypothetical protein